MASILYIFDNPEDKNMVKDALANFMRTKDAVKFNAEHSISIEGYDVLTFLNISHEHASDIMIENAPYEHVKLINMPNLSNDVIQYIMNGYVDYNIYDIEWDFKNQNDDILLNLLDGTTHNYRDIFSGKTELVDDVFLNLVKLANE